MVPRCCTQVYTSNTTYESRTDIPFDRYLQPDARRMKYRRRKSEAKTVIHWGQRKLFISELSFLTQYAEPGHTVVYAGAAPGTHSAYLIKLFPELNFVLVDPAPFSRKLAESDRVALRQELFTDDVAREFTDYKVLFICDIRSADWQMMSEKVVEERVWEDMEAQMRWHDIIAPVKSMLKFRLPWTAGSSEYLDGDIELPVWGPITTTEARLIPSNGRRQWEHTKYEEQMFYFNTVTRVGRYHHDCDVDPAAAEGLDYCFDCKAEVEVIKEFLCKKRGMFEGPDLVREVVAMSRKLTRECGSGRTLLTGNVDPGQRKTVIKKRQWIEGQPAYDHARAKETNAKKPGVYSDVAKKLMEGMGYEQGTGLGRRGAGIVQPVAASSQVGRRGLGLAPRRVPQRAEEARQALARFERDASSSSSPPAAVSDERQETDDEKASGPLADGEGPAGHLDGDSPALGSSDGAGVAAVTDVKSAEEPAGREASADEGAAADQS